MVINHALNKVEATPPAKEQTDKPTKRRKRRPSTRSTIKRDNSSQGHHKDGGVKPPICPHVESHCVHGVRRDASRQHVVPLSDLMKRDSVDKAT